MFRLALGILIGGAIAAYAAPSVQQIEEALHLWPGGKTTLNIGGYPLQVEYIGIEPRHGHEYAIIVRAY